MNRREFFKNSFGIAAGAVIASQVRLEEKPPIEPRAPPAKAKIEFTIPAKSAAYPHLYSPGEIVRIKLPHDRGIGTFVLTRIDRHCIVESLSRLWDLAIDPKAKPPHITERYYRCEATRIKDAQAPFLAAAHVEKYSEWNCHGERAFLFLAGRPNERTVT